jgi:cytoskeletal protein CcmA (bactofilin family)
MKKGKNTEVISTYLGSGVTVAGTILFKDTIRLDGKVKGKITSNSGTVIVGEKAVLHADIVADVVIVMGEVNGKIDGRKRIEAHPPGRIIGDIQAPVVAIEQGVVFNGNCAIKARASSSEKTGDALKKRHPLKEVKGA